MDDSDDSASPPPITESLASTRERRANAGANMSKLLDKEEEDEFYQTQYGGFIDVENDNDFSMSDSSDSENVIDSDFDIEEQADNETDDEQKQDKLIAQEELRLKRQAAKRKTGVYKEPATSKPKQPANNRQLARSSIRSKPIRKPASSSVDHHSSTSMYKNLRESTKKSSRETKEFLEDERRRKLRSKNKFKRKHYRQPTQEERLREAKRTEVENIRSLQQYKNLEIEKSKRNKLIKRAPPPNVPLIRYHSFLDDKKQSHRTIISFPNEQLYDDCFARYKQQTSQSNTSPNISSLSNLPVRYKDPLTGYPFSIAKEFSIIRDAYVRYLEISPLKNNQAIKKFIEANRIIQSNRVRVTCQSASNQLSTGSTVINGQSSSSSEGYHHNAIQYRTLKKIINNPQIIRRVSNEIQVRNSVTGSGAGSGKPVSVYVITTNNKAQVHQFNANSRSSTPEQQNKPNSQQ